jgi:hypothetical protein
VDQQQWLLAGREVDEGIRRVGQRRPRLERRLHAIRQVMVVEEDQRRSAGVQQQGVVAGACQGVARAFLHDLEMRGEQLGPAGRILFNGG